MITVSWQELNNSGFALTGLIQALQNVFSAFCSAFACRISHFFRTDPAEIYRFRQFHSSLG